MATTGVVLQQPGKEVDDMLGVEIQPQVKDYGMAVTAQPTGYNHNHNNRSSIRSQRGPMPGLELLETLDMITIYQNLHLVEGEFLVGTSVIFQSCFDCIEAMVDG